MKQLSIANQILGSDGAVTFRATDFVVDTISTHVFTLIFEEISSQRSVTLLTTETILVRDAC
jgi:hypothetical protein